MTKYKPIKVTKDGGIIKEDQLGNKQYDLSKSSSILKDMNRAILDETKKSGSAPGAAQWFLDAIATGQIELPQRDDITTNLLEDKSITCSKNYLLLPGRMFTFLYRPKTKADLRYYDTTPLIITLPTPREAESGVGYSGVGYTSEQNNSKTVLGMNLHYLEPELREAFLEKLLHISSKSLKGKIPPKGIGYFRIDYDLLNSIRYVFGMPCIRSYDMGRIIGRPVIIPSNQWGNAVSLPYENFVKAKNKKIWVESRRLIREFIKSMGKD